MTTTQPTTGCYQIRHSINSQGIRIYTAEYITHAGEVRYMMHAAVIDPCVKLINALTGRNTLMHRRG